MFKAQILRRSFSLFRRAPNSHVIRSAARDGHETIRIQRVRFSKPFLSRSRLIGTLVFTTSAYGILRWLEETEEEQAERKRREKAPESRRPKTINEGIEVDGEEEEEEDEGEALIFFPTGFSRPKRRTFYRGSDPEWQEFIRLAPDRQRMERIRGELVSLVRRLAMKNPHYTLRLGKINPTAGTSWIEHKFPDGPPIEYERPGIELTDELTFRWTTRPVDELHHQRLTRILVPTAVANSLYADSKKRVEKSWQDFRTYMGWEDKSKPKPRIIAQFPHPPPSPPETSSTAPTAASTSTSGSHPTPPATSDTHQPPASSSSPPGKEAAPSTPGNPAYERFGIALPNPTSLTLDLSTFRQAFRKEYKPYKKQPPRGTFVVSGLIEIIGERARMTLDVSAVYDPKIGQYVMLKAQLRSITDFKQVPKGGH